MPVLAAFLESRGEQLQKVAVEVILQAASNRALSNVMAATGAEIREFGANEIAEGLLREIAAEALADESDALAAAGVELAAEGIDELATAAELNSAARDIAAEGLAQGVTGAAEIGAAMAEETLAEADDEREN
jgi:hypothetical protein